MNAVIKKLQKWKEAPTDEISFFLYDFQNYYRTEILRGYGNTGNYSLNEKFAHFVHRTRISVNATSHYWSIKNSGKGKGRGPIKERAIRAC